MRPCGVMLASALKLLLISLAVLVAVTAAVPVSGCGSGAGSVATGAKNPSQERLARNAAVRWVAAMQRGDLAGACRVSTRTAVGNTPCRSLPSVAYNCPAQLPGQHLPRVPARRAASQLGKLTLHGAHANVKLRSEFFRRRKPIATLRLRRENLKWRVGLLHYGHRVLNFLKLTQPGVGPDRLYGKLFIGGCSEPVFHS